MAAPETQRQAAGIAATGYSPVTTQLNAPIQLPSTGELWAKVGQTALEAGDRIANVPGQMAQNRAAMAGIDQYNTLKRAGLAPLLTATDPSTGRAYTIAPGQIQDRATLNAVLQRLGINPMKVGNGTTGGPPAPGTGTGTGDGQSTPPSTPSTPAQPDTNPPSMKSEGTPQTSIQSPSNMYAANTGTAAPAAPAANPNLYASSESGPLPSYGNENVKFPGGSFQPPAQTTSPGSAIPSQFAAPRPMTPSPQDMANWQAANAQPVADSGSALEWAKRFHTGYKTATYLPHAGPGGEPAYNFSDGKSSNIVPISQMVKNGFGPSVAAQSTSSVLSTAERIQQAGQGTTGPGLPLGPVSPAQPAPQQPPPGQSAPPAPSAQGGQVGNPQQPAPLAGQPPAAPGQGPLLTSTAYPPDPYRQAIAQAVAQPGALAAETGQQAGARTDVAPQSLAPIVLSDSDRAQIQAAADRAAKTANYANKGDQPLGQWGGFNWFRNDSPEGGGIPYALAPSDPGQYYNPMRWSLGEGQWRAVELPESEQRRQMQYFVDKGDYYKGKPLTADVVNGMNSAQIAPWLRHKWELENLKPSGAEGTPSTSLDALEQIAITNKRIQDEVQTLGENGVPNLSSLDKWFSGIGRMGTSLGIPGEDIHTNKAIQNLQQDIDRATGLIKDHPELQLDPGTSQGETITPELKEFFTEIPKIATPGSNLFWDSFSGEGYKSALDTLKGFQQRVIDRYDKFLGNTETARQLVDSRHRENVAALKNGGELPDPDNPYKAHQYRVYPGRDYYNFAHWHPQTPYVDAEHPADHYVTPKGGWFNRLPGEPLF